jgi:hypothetical protein
VYDKPHCKPVLAHKYFYTSLERRYEAILLQHLGLRSMTGEYVLDKSFDEVCAIAHAVVAGKPY